MDQRNTSPGDEERNTVPYRRLAHLAVDGQVWPVVPGEGGPGNWDFALASVGISGKGGDIYMRLRPVTPVSAIFKPDQGVVDQVRGL